MVKSRIVYQPISIEQAVSATILTAVSDLLTHRCYAGGYDDYKPESVSANVKPVMVWPSSQLYELIEKLGFKYNDKAACRLGLVSTPDAIKATSCQYRCVPLRIIAVSNLDEMKLYENTYRRDMFVHDCKFVVVVLLVTAASSSFASSSFAPVTEQQMLLYKCMME